MSSNREELIEETIFNCLEQQISELELLKSMYPDDIIMTDTDNKVLEHIEQFLNKKTEYTPGHLDFVLNIFVENLKLEVCVNLPSFYPKEEPEIYVRCNQLNRHQESALNSELTDYIRNNYQGEVCLYTVISWLQENVDTFVSKVVDDNKPQIEQIQTDDKFIRLWIYSHHIYNKRKREEILKKAKELNVTGFCLPGKPGVICIEGLERDCNEWWRDIKAMSWKKISVRKTEVFELCEQKTQQKFGKFEELHFQNTGTSRNTKHADMSGFSKFMEERGLTEIFNDFFGLCSNEL